MSDLKNKLIRLAYTNPEYRQHLLPLLAETGGDHGPHRIARSKTGSYEQTADHMRRKNGDVIVGKFVRLTYDDYNLFVEELPQKGKRKLGWMYLNADWLNRSQHLPHFLMPNFLQDMKFSKGDTFKAVERKVEKTIVDLAMQIEEEYADHPAEYDAEYIYKHVNLTIDDVWYLKVAPSSAAPITAAGSDFTVTSSWTKFEAKWSYNDDPHDPSYTVVESKSAQGARKLYKILNSNPDALDRVDWSDFTSWLDRNKIAYKQWSSSWR